MIKKIRKGELILRFINDAGGNGRRFTEIQKFILNLNHPDVVYDYSTRGYYCDALSGTINYTGLLKQFCIKNKKRRWVCPVVPKGTIYKSRF